MTVIEFYSANSNGMYQMYCNGQEILPTPTRLDIRSVIQILGVLKSVR